MFFVTCPLKAGKENGFYCIIANDGEIIQANKTLSGASIPLLGFTHPDAVFSPQHTKEQLQFFDCDAVTGHDSQHVHQEV